MELILTDIFAVGVCLAWMLTTKTYSKPHPPGPKGLPLLGNMLDMPTSHEWLKAAEWKKVYGDVIFLSVLGKSIVFLNSYKAVTDLMDKQSNACSSRPHSQMGDLIKWDWFMAVMPYGETWRKHRATTQKVLDPAAVADVAEQQVQEVAKLINNLIKASDGFLRHIRGSITSTIMLITYGHEVKSGDDPYVTLAEKTSAIFSDMARPGAFLVEAIPLLKLVPVWFPGAYFQRLAERGYKLSQEMKFRPYRDMKEKVLNGTARPSVISKLIEESMVTGDNSIDDEEKIANVAGMLYAAGADALTSVMETFVLAMVLYPEVQIRAQKELDRVIGSDRLPNLRDREHLPYVTAICSECLRWQPVTPIGVPHATSAEVEYKGYSIPKDSTLIANQWLILNDPKEYPNPEEFDPERFLPRKPGFKPARDPSKVAFGFGRRICPGRFMAMNTIFIAISSILATLNIEKEIGPDMKPITPKIDYVPGFTRHPNPFECRITPRSTKTEGVIHQYLDN